MTERTTRAKKTAARARPRKTTPARAQEPDQQDQDQQDTTPLEAEITFRDRKIRVRMPLPEQILVWKRIMARLEGANAESWTGKEVLEALERTRKIIDAVMIDPADIDWLDDEMLAGRVGIQDAADIVVDAVKAFQNRSQRRAAAKASPARRKAPTKTTTSQE